MKKLTFIIAVFFSIVAFAQSTSKDPEAKKILDAVKTKYSAYENIKADFTYTITDKELGEPASFGGEIFLKGKKFRIDTDDYLIVSNNKFLWTNFKASKSLQIQDYDPEELAEELGFEPDNLFNIKADDFNYKLNGKSTLNEEEVNVVELTPLDKEKPYYKIKMYVSLKNEVRKVEFFESMSTYDIVISNQKANTDMDDSIFTVDKSKFDKDKVEDLTTK